MIRKRETGPAHDPLCLAWGGACICNRCAHDNYHQGTFVRCCQRHNAKRCPQEKCRDFIPAEQTDMNSRENGGMKA